MNAQISVQVEGSATRVRWGGVTLFEHTAKRPLVALGWGSPEFIMDHGNFTIRPHLRRRLALRRCVVDAVGDASATLRFPVPGSDHSVELRLDAATDGVTFSLASAGSGPSDHDRVWLSFAARERGEPLYGGGEQYSRFDVRGSRLPVWVAEQGVGRGHNLVTVAANLHSGAGGAWHTTYFPQPTWASPSGRAVHLDAVAYTTIDARSPHGETVETWQPHLSGRIFVTDDLSAAVGALSSHLGRQPELPDWADSGFVVGLQGGRDIVRRKVDVARDAGIALAGVWAQDWEGRRVTSFGSQLFWDWRYSDAMYPDLPRFIEELRNEGLRFMGYINPFLAIEGELYREAGPAGYCVKDASGADYLITVTTFPAALLDLTNPDAVAWIKGVIRRNMIGIGLSGWMADFGEYLPTDARLAGGEAAARFHNRYPAEWARVNREAISEAGASDEVAIFMRAGYTGTSRYTNLIWAGDQMVDWSRHDGLPSVIPAALSLGISGIGLHSSDVGGYTTLFGRKRTKELFMRWAEAAVWTPFFRSHEGNRPGDNWQWDGDAETMAHLARMSRTFVALKPYRRAVLAEYHANGLPAQRPVVMHDAAATMRRPSDYRWMLGSELLVAPVIARGRKRATVELPAGEWVHLWSGTRQSGRCTVAAPLGEPPVFYRAGSRWAATFDAAASAAASAAGA